MVAQIVEIIDVQLLNGQECLSRFHYLDVSGALDPALLVSAYVDDVIPLAQAFQSAVTSHVAIRHRVVYPTASLVQETAITPVKIGLNADTPGQDYASWSVKFGIGDTTYLTGGIPPHIRKGGKHLPGVTIGYTDEEPLAGGGVATAVAAWFPVAKAPVADTWALVVASFELSRSHKTKVGTTTTIVHPAPSPTVTKYAPVLSASPPSVSTQNTRKKLRGRTY
jgi:hypothetical protein